VVPRSLSSTAAAAVRMREPPPPVVVVTSAPHHAVHLMANGGGGGSGMSKDSDDQDHHLHNSSMNNNSSRTGLMVLMDDDSKRSNHHHVLYGMNDSTTRLSHFRIFYAEHCIYLLPVRLWRLSFLFPLPHHSSWLLFSSRALNSSYMFSLSPMLFLSSPCDGFLSVECLLTTSTLTIMSLSFVDNRCWVGFYFRPPCRRTTNTCLVTRI
jgi:hypothetical protein